MRGAASCSCPLLLLLVLVLPLLSDGAPAAPGGCGPGCRCFHLPEGGRAANCSRFHTAHGELLPADLRSLRVLPDAPGLASFLEGRLARHAPHLEELYLADNEVVGPRLRSLRGLHKLRVLDLSFCELPDALEVASLVKRSKSLETLRLSGNSLISLPTFASDSLRELDVSGCSIAGLRVDTFTRLRSLRRLNLARNSLSSLDAHLPHSLRFLNLSGNSLTHLPKKLVAMLHRVDVSNNPLVCTCALLRLRNQLTDEYVVVGVETACTGPRQPLGLSPSRARSHCESLVGSTTEARRRRQADPLDLLEGSGGGEGDGIGEDEELDEEAGDDFVDDDYDEEIDDGTEIEGAGDEGASQFVPQNVGPGSAVSSSSAPPIPASSDDTTRSLEDDIYEPTVPPPVPAAVDADAGAQPPSETPPESGPPMAESVEGNHAESAPDDTGDVDGNHELSEHEEESEPVAAGFVPDSEGEKKNDGKEEEANTDIDDVFNEVMKSEDEVEDENEDYDYDEEPASATDESSIPDHAPLDTGKEGEPSTAPQSNETLSSPESGERKEILDSSLLLPEEESDKDYEESDADIEEKGNEVENTDDVIAVDAKTATAEPTETEPVPSDKVHTNITSDSLVPVRDVEPHEDNEQAGTDIKIIGETEGSGEGEDDDSLPVGPITGFIDSNGNDGPTTTEETDEGTLLIDEEEETDEGDVPLVPPGADDGSKITSTEENIVAESDGKFVVGNDTETENSVSSQDDGEEEGSGMPIVVGGDWDVEKANETDEEAEVTSLEPTEIHEEGLIVHQIIPLQSGREMSSSSESPLTTSTTEGPVGRGGLFRFDRPEEEGGTTSEAPAHTVLPFNVGAEGVSSSTAPPDEVEEHIVTAAAVPIAEAVPSEEPALLPMETSPSSPPLFTSELPVDPGAPEWADKEPTPGPEPDDVDEGEISEVETVMPTGDAPSNDTARVIVAGGEKPPEETPLNSAGSYVVLGIIMALVVFLLGYAVMRSRRGRQRAAAKANGKDAEAAGGQQEGRELKEISKPLLGTPAAVPAANGKGEHLQPLVTKPTDNPDLKDDDGDEPMPEKPLLEPKTHIYETLNGGEKERVPVHPPSPKKSPSRAPDALPGDGDTINSHTPPVPEKRRVLSRLPETAVDGAPNMYAAEGLPGEVVAQPQQQQPTANGAATSPVNGLSSFAPPVSPSSGRVKVVAREDPDSVPKKPVFVMNQGPSTASGVV